MFNVNVEESLLIGATPTQVFRILVEPDHHKHILPDAFTDFRAEGDGIVSAKLRYGRTTTSLRLQTNVLEPNKLLRENDLEKGISTEFRLDERREGTLVTISTKYTTARSFKGLIESILAPTFLHQLYKEELVKLGRYVLVASL